MLKPNPTKVIVVPIMYKLLGRDKTYHIIAKGEYKAADKYISVVKDFPEECKRAFEMGAELAR